jgi:prepilin peptidase dependent protein B
MRLARIHRRAAARGMSLVELMVGIVVGLFIVAGATYFVVNFNAENRRLLLEARLTQDMRAAMDIVTRDLRRAGYWQNAASGVSLFTTAVPSVYYESTNFGVVTPASGVAATSVTYAYDKSGGVAAAASDQFAFGLSGGVLTTTIGGSGAQPLTDANTTVVTTFEVSPDPVPVWVSVSCSPACAGASCPRVYVRQFTVTLSAASALDASIARTLKNRVRIRNDMQTGAC